MKRPYPTPIASSMSITVVTRAIILSLLATNCYTRTEATSSIPRSTNTRSIATKNNSGCGTSGSNGGNGGNGQSSSLPPWNPSPKIDPDGFLTEAYPCVPGEWELEANIGGKHSGLKEPVRIRQVPGDGNCLFHSITVAMAAIVNGTHIDMAGASARRRLRRRNRMRSRIHLRASDGSDADEAFYDDEDEDEDEMAFDLQHLHQHSTLLRQRAVDVLSLNPRRLLFLQGNEYLRARDLVDAAAAQYDLNGEEYCDLMRRESYWGGGPEIVALCNVLRRPIHVYELSGSNEDYDDDEHEDSIINYVDRDGNTNNANNKQQFRLRRMACFGSPKFDRREPLHILSADSRFPDVTPGEQLSSGNHFLALLPDECMQAMEEARRKRLRGWRRRKRSAGVRGGGWVAGEKEELGEDGLRQRMRGDDTGNRRERSWLERERQGKARTVWSRMLRCVAPGCGNGQEGDSDGPLSTLIQFAIRLFLRV